VVFLDEFSTGRILLKRAIMGRLRQESARGRTIVLTTQILSEAGLCDDILIMRSGRQATRRINTLAAFGRAGDIGHVRRAARWARRGGRPYHRFAAVTQNSALITVRGTKAAFSSWSHLAAWPCIEIEVSAQASKTSRS
jgi:ABC-type multidrug transport system ATPase subunit